GDLRRTAGDHRGRPRGRRGLGLTFWRRDLVEVGARAGGLPGELAADREDLQVRGGLVDRQDLAEQVQLTEPALPPRPLDRLRHLIRGGVASLHGAEAFRQSEVMTGEELVD